MREPNYSVEAAQCRRHAIRAAVLCLGAMIASSVHAASPCPDHATGTITRSGDTVRIHCECDAGYVQEGIECLSVPRVELHRPGALSLPSPTWDCYCAYRFVTRPNGRTYPEVMRTPEQQVAFEALQILDEKSKALKLAADKYSSTDDPFVVAVKESGKAALTHAAIEVVIVTLSPEAPPAALAAQAKQAEAAVRTWERLKPLVTAGLTLGHVGYEVKESASALSEAQKELERAKREVREAGEVWEKSNQRAKNVPRLDHVLSKPFTVIFTNGRDGGRVAIVKRSADGKTRGITPVGPVSFTGTWDGN